MPYLTVGRDAGNIDIYYEDHGVGKPVVLIHGFPLSGREWEKQVPPLLETGHRVVVYDRRGFGRSTQTIKGYDFDTFAEDLRKLIKHLDLRDVALVGNSMGAGEVARYIGRYGSLNISRLVFIGGSVPYLTKSEANPAGVDIAMRTQLETALKKDRLTFLTQFPGEHVQRRCPAGHTLDGGGSALFMADCGDGLADWDAEVYLYVVVRFSPGRREDQHSFADHSWRGGQERTAGGHVAAAAAVDSRKQAGND